MCSATEGHLQRGHCCDEVDTVRLSHTQCVINIHVTSDEDGLSAAEAGSQLVEADTLWPGRPLEAPSDSGGHTQSSDISESGRVSGSRAQCTNVISLCS